MAIANVNVCLKFLVRAQVVDLYCFSIRIHGEAHDKEKLKLDDERDLMVELLRGTK